MSSQKFQRVVLHTTFPIQRVPRCVDIKRVSCKYIHVIPMPSSFRATQIIDAIVESELECRLFQVENSLTVVAQHITAGRA